MTRVFGEFGFGETGFGEMGHNPLSYRRKAPWRDDIILWKAGNPIVRDVTAICITGSSYIDPSIREAGAAAEITATHKTAKLLFGSKL